MVSVFVPDGIVMAADSRQTVGITAVKPVNGAHGHGNTHSEPNGPSGAAGVPCGNDSYPNRTTHKK